MKMMEAENINNDRNWSFPLTGFVFYIVIALIDSLGLVESFNTNYLGAVFLFLFLLMGYFIKRNSFLNQNLMVVIAFIIIYLSVINLLINIEQVRPIIVIKNIATYAVFILLCSYNLSPVYKTKGRYYLMGLVVFYLFMSLFFETPEAGVRFSGLAYLSNVFAMATLTLLFFINEDEDSLKKKLGIHLVIIYFLVIANVVGAIASYLIGMLYKYFRTITIRSAIKTSIVIIVIIALILSIGVSVLEHPTALRVVNSVKVTYLVLIGDICLEDRSLNDIASEYGRGTTSGAWRLQWWKPIWSKFWQGDILNILFGYGVGSAMGLSGGYDVHNEYLRLFFELGIIGFLFTIIFFVMAFKRINAHYRYIIIIVAVWSLFENIMGNFVFMSLFVLLISGKKEDGIKDFTG